MTNDLNQERFRCPRSGEILGIVVRSLGLEDGAIGGNTAVYLRSESNEGRTTRRYFAGEAMPEETRKEICLYTAQALVSSGLLKMLKVPPRVGKSRASTEGFIAEVLFDFLGTWDSVYHQAADGWPYPPQALGGFIVGRQATLDVAIRIASVLQLCGITREGSFVVAASSPHPTRDLFDYLKKQAGATLSRTDLATKLRVAEKSTVDGWLDDDAAPGRQTVERMAKLFATKQCPEESLLRWLRLQFAMIAIARRLRRSVGEFFACELIHTFARTVDFVQAFSERCRAYKRLDLREFGTTLEIILRKGAQCEESRGAYGAFLDHIDYLLPQSKHYWLDDVMAIDGEGPKARIEACFSVVGDWPKFCARIAQIPKKPASPEDGMRRREVLALIETSPTALEAMSKELHGDAVREFKALQGFNMLRAGRTDKAVSCLTPVAEADPDNADIRCYLGMALCQTDDSGVAAGREHLRHAIRLRPDWDIPIAALSRSYAFHGDFKQSLAVLADAPVSVVSRSCECLMLRASCLQHLGLYTEALAAAEDATGLDPSSPEAWCLASDLAFLLGNGERGRRYHKQALHLGSVTVRRSGIAYRDAICPNPAAVSEPPIGHTPPPDG